MGRKKNAGGIIAPFIIGSESHPWGGLNTSIKDPRFLGRGESPDQLNWITSRDKDRIELRRGQALLGLTRRNNPGSYATGLGVGVRNDGVQVPFFSYDRKILFYDSTINDTAEVGSNIIPTVASGEDMNFMPYENLAGSFVYITSPKSSIYKIAAANPASVSDQFPSGGDFNFGFAKINRARMSGMNRQGRSQQSQDNTGLYLSHADKQLVTEYDINYMTRPLNLTTTITASGGSLAIGTYYFCVTAFGPNGVETTRSAQTTVVITVNNSQVDLFWPNVAGATAYSIYGSVVSNTFTDPAVVIQGLAPQPPNVPTNIYNIDNAVFTTGAPPATSTQGIIAAIGTGNGVATTFTGTLPNNNPVFHLTNFYIAVTDGYELLLDDRSGGLVGSNGGTGTINYITGAYSVTFGTAPANGAPVTASYYQEDSVDGGVCDFLIDLTDTTNASAQIFRQDDGGGKAQAVWPYQGVEYCFHVLRTWNLSISQTSSSPVTVFENQPYYEQIGIPSPRAVFPTGEGILFLNLSNPANPTVSILQIPPGSTNLTVVPVPLSQDLDLSYFQFQKCVVFSWGDLDIMSCQDVRNGEPDTYNSATFIRNKYSGLWNRLDYYISAADIYNGSLIAADSLSTNVFTLFSGFDDDEEAIENYYESSATDLDVPGLKTVGYLNLQGLIQSSQKLEVYIQLDTGGYYLAYTILGTGDYVSQDPISVGSEVIGLAPVGGGNGNTPIFANSYELDIPLHTDKFEYISFKLRAIDVGYVSVDQATYKDTRFKRRRIGLYNDLEIDN